MSAANDELEQLRAELAEVLSQRDHALKAHLETIRERDYLSSETNRMRVELATAKAERDEAVVRADAQFQTRLEELAERDVLKAKLDRIVAELEAEREKTREAEGATARDEHVINGIVNGLGIALRIVRGAS